MKSSSPLPFPALLAMGASAFLVPGAWAQGDGIDRARARELHQKAQSGQTLTAEERADYERAKASRTRGRPSPQSRAAPPEPAEPITPLTELGAEKYKGEDGGLYGGGRNEPPQAHFEEALKEAAKIQPLDAEGTPATDGKIVLVSIGKAPSTRSPTLSKEPSPIDGRSRNRSTEAPS